MKNISRKEVIVNLSFWLFIAIAEILIRPKYGSDAYMKSRSFLTLVNIITLSSLPVFYLNVFLLIPQFLEKNKYVLYIKRTAIAIFSSSFIGVTILFLIQQFIFGFDILENIPLLFALPLVFVGAHLLFNLPASFLYYLLKSLIVKKKVSRVSEIGIHLFLGGIFWVFIFITGVQHWDIHSYPFPFFLTIGYTCLLWIFSMAVFYANSFWNIPSYLAKKKSGKYILSVLLLIGGAVFLDGFMFTLVPDFNLVMGKKLVEPYVMQSLRIKLFLIIPISFLYRFSKDWITNLEIKRKLTESELFHLKSQINPHFLFNTLNSLYATSLEENSPKTSEGIAKLSNLMRYTLHDSSKEYILLDKEIEYIEDYISLQKGRLPDHLNQNINYRISGELDHKKIAPMLLISFIENAFQHGISMEEASFIEIEINIQDDYLILKTRNSKFQDKPKGNGLGIENTIKRLDILYQGDYNITINDQENEYSMVLSLNLN